ncbi:MAG: hypothetical protein RL641_319 [Candidatus Parcubacteria bacterium]|jgi:hypothetical protein
MRSAKKLTCILAITILSFGIALSARAVGPDKSFITNPTAIRDNDINVDLIPEVPGPNQNVKIILSSYSTDINKAVITWSINGNQSLAGTGKTTFSFTTGDIGSKTEVGISIIVVEGSRIDKRITIQPSQVDLLWEAPESYVPPFYKGKALVSKESKVKVVALTLSSDGSIDTGNKVYNWKKNRVIDQQNSGYGKYSFIVKNSYLDLVDDVTVNVSSKSGEGSVGSLSINYVSPQIMFYEKNPALGLKLNNLLNSGFSIGNGEMTISAEPFYFSEKSGSVLDKNMEYKWTINSTGVTPPGKSNELTLRADDQRGMATINLVITNIMTLFQEARKSVSVTLGN